MKLSHAPKYHPEVSPKSTPEPTATDSGDTPLHQNAAAAIEETSATVSFKTIKDVPGIGAIALGVGGSRSPLKLNCPPAGKSRERFNGCTCFSACYHCQVSVPLQGKDRERPVHSHFAIIDY